MRSRIVEAFLITVLFLRPFLVQGFTRDFRGHKMRNAQPGMSRAVKILPYRSINIETALWQALGSDEEKPRPRRRKNFRMKLFSALNLPIIEVFSILAVILSSFLVALDTLDGLPPEYYFTIDNSLIALDFIFAADFFVRWYAAGQFKFIYLTKPLAILDIIVVILPLFLFSIVPLLEDMGAVREEGILSFLSGLRNSAGLQNLLLLRLLRIRRILTDLKTFGRFEVALGLKPQDVRPYQLQLARALLSIFTLLSVSSGLIYTAEHEVNPGITDYFGALYFGLTSLTTVGLGDIVPMTSQGRLVVSGSILAGVAIIPSQAAALVNAFIESQKDVRVSKRRFRSTGPRYDVTAIDGKGPSGVPLETLPADNVDVSLGQDKSGGPFVSGLPCPRCQATPHRSDARFCWACGSTLFETS